MLAMNLIVLKHISKVFADGAKTKALNNISLSIASGEFAAIVGPSGSGKSTLMNIIGLLDAPTRGDYILGGHDVSRHNDVNLARLRLEKIGFVFQSFNLIPRLTLAQNIQLPMTYAGLSASERRERAKQLLEQVGLSARADYLPSQVSGGEAQRAAIARALANRPSIILADEPTGNLDSKTSSLIIKLLKELHRSGVTVIVITHNPEIAKSAERIIKLGDGKIHGGKL